MKISVVMAAYNGENYIIGQLESIKNQTRQLDEVLIVDDCSTDRTVETVDDYIGRNKLNEIWHIIQNKENKRVVRNFLDGAREAKGDIIFYSDQDDIWDKEKIRLMEQGFIEHPDMQACYCLRNLIDGDGNMLPLPITSKLSNVPVKTDGFQKISVSEAIKYNKSPGLCLAIRKELIEETREMILENRLTHDLPIGSVASIKNGYYVLNKRLVNYRQHGNNVSSPRLSINDRISKYETQIESRNMRLRQMRVILNHYGAQMTPKDRDHLSGAIQWTEKSIEALRSHNSMALARQFFTMNPMNNRWIAANNFMTCIKDKN